MQSAITLLGEVIQSRPDIGLDKAATELAVRGVDETLARRLVTFVPLARGRALMDGMGNVLSHEQYAALSHGWW